MKDSQLLKPAFEKAVMNLNNYIVSGVENAGAAQHAKICIKTIEAYIGLKDLDKD